MELLNPGYPLKPSPSPPLHFSLFTLMSPSTTPHAPLSSKFSKSTSFPLYLRRSATRHLLVSARQFGGPTSRRNTLRKKLIDHQQVLLKKLVPLGPISTDFQNPVRKLDDFNDSIENLGEFGSVGENEASSSGMLKVKSLSDSDSLRKLGSWVDQYKKDVTYWGVGSNPIFTVFEDLDGNVEKVLVDEDEILRRSQVRSGESEGLMSVKSKILYARGLAKQMEDGGNVILRNSSVSKFVVSGEESGFIGMVRGVVNRPEFVPVLSGVGRLVFCGIVAIWAAKKLLSNGNKEENYTELEKEMMRRKIKARKEKEMLEKGRVEVLQEHVEESKLTVERPRLDKELLMRSILEAKGLDNKLVLKGSSDSKIGGTMDWKSQVQDIQVEAMEAREMESREQTTISKDGVENLLMDEKSSGEIVEVKKQANETLTLPNGHQNSDSNQILDLHQVNTGYDSDASAKELNDHHASTGISSNGVHADIQIRVGGGLNESSDIPDYSSSSPNNGTVEKRTKLIRSVKEAREFLAKKAEKQVQKSLPTGVEESITNLCQPDDKILGSEMRQGIRMGVDMHKDPSLNGTSESLPDVTNCDSHSPKGVELGTSRNDDCKDLGNRHGVDDAQKSQSISNGHVSSSSAEKKHNVNSESWMQKNFHEVEPMVKKIGDGFKQNYMEARGKAGQLMNTNIDVNDLDFDGGESELEWMKDDSLREIVFHVRENELAGRDPFYLMDAEDKLKFFEGLEKKVEMENKRLYQVHEYLHANIENLDYGAEGISLYDPPEKIIPRWKGPPLAKNPEFLDNFQKARNMLSRNAGNSNPVKNESSLLQKSMELQMNEKLTTGSGDNALMKPSLEKDPKDSKIVIEGSDGSIRAGKKSGKEFWQHTKKWSRGFLESYNAETDPDIKATMKDIGKDLDRWITEEEIQEAAKLMDKLPERNKKFMEKKINKLKREMELFGPQAVVSKYREYAEDKEEDYLWWLDLPHVLCIELYMVENGEQNIGLYSLEMAADLELEPKPCHVIAFEDAGDCKNLCYIIQAHLDMIGKGHAFVIARPPKDAFREARANGFSVSVIRKGELQLNVDQTLEEVEEQIKEIGSKIYHDKLMRERSVDINSIMKGVFGVSDRHTSRRKLSKRKLKNPTNK